MQTPVSSVTFKSPKAVSVCALCGEGKIVGILALRAMNTLYLPAALVRIEEWAFEAVDAQAVVIPDGCETIENNAFLDCASLIYVRIPTGTNVADNAFAGCPDSLLLDRAK